MMKPLSPIFVIGSPRSGTSFLYKVLRTHSSFVSEFEPLYFRHLSTLEPNNKLKTYVERILIDEVERKNANRFLAKDPPLSKMLPLLDRLLPQSQFVHIIRDGRDVAASMVAFRFLNPSAPGALWAPKTFYEAARLWEGYVTAACRAGSGLGSERYLEVRYEDFQKTPSQVTNKIFEFLHEIPSRECLEVAKTFFKKPRTWKESLNSEQLAEFYRCEPATQLLEELGYEDRGGQVLYGMNP